MAWRMIAAATAALAAGCYSEAPPPANNQTETAQPAPAPAPAAPVETRFDRTMSGQLLNRDARPPAPYQLLVTQATYPPGYLITCHKHSWPRFVYLQAGQLTVTNFATRRDYPFTAGQILVESIDEWHQGQVGNAGATLVVFELVPPGRNNRTEWPPPPPPESPCRAVPTP